MVLREIYFNEVDGYISPDNEEDGYISSDNEEDDDNKDVFNNMFVIKGFISLLFL